MRGADEREYLTALLCVICPAFPSDLFLPRDSLLIEVSGSELVCLATVDLFLRDANFVAFLIRFLVCFFLLFLLCFVVFNFFLFLNVSCGIFFFKCGKSRYQ